MLKVAIEWRLRTRVMLALGYEVALRVSGTWEAFPQLGKNLFVKVCGLSGSHF